MVLASLIWSLANDFTHNLVISLLSFLDNPQVVAIEIEETLSWSTRENPKMSGLEYDLLRTTVLFLFNWYGCSHHSLEERKCLLVLLEERERDLKHSVPKAFLTSTLYTIPCSRFQLKDLKNVWSYEFMQSEDIHKQTTLIAGKIERFKTSQSKTALQLCALSPGSKSPSSLSHTLKDVVKFLPLLHWVLQQAV